MTKYSYKKKGEKLFNDGEYLEAIKNFDNSIKGSPKNYESWKYRGLCKYFLNQYEEAVKDLDKAIELYDKFHYQENEISIPFSWCFRGLCKYHLNQYEEAVKDLDKAAKLFPGYYDNFGCWGFKGRSNYFLSRYEEAIKDLTKAIEHDDENYISWDFRGRSNYFLNQFEETIKDALFKTSSALIFIPFGNRFLYSQNSLKESKRPVLKPFKCEPP